ncbi:hypothetical protein SELMODRAFT_100598 [Selaginella moellendorffii]|uniref:Neprosin PEP catalytic domain-containing protein n=1 Tax=Selaginella moellendorffii TaxID=88036 RepID=D8RSW0_SELML|nr:hypothetical protein SELMODRAFT_100598 [Selaginella moellendorffii]
MSCRRRLSLVLLLFLIHLASALETGAINATGTAHRRRLSRRQVLELRKKLNNINKPAVHTIRSPDGDIIDCVLISNQPAFDHPLLKDHKLQVKPDFWPDQEDGAASTESSPGDDKVSYQLWHQSGECPEGTVPIRRTTIDDILRVGGSVSRYGRKARPPPNPRRIRPPEPAQGSHEHAIAFINGGQYYGAQASLNVWKPAIQVPNEFSLSQMWLLAGSFYGDLNSIEAGWQVSPLLYGDSNPRLFTYWTSDAYRTTGCYNLLCSGFIQLGRSIAIGATISPLSLLNGAQYDIRILIWKDPRTKNWWMRFGPGILLGYWPAELFTHLGDHASMIEWGGEIVNTAPRGHHTATQMGSGHFPSQGFGQASYFRNLGYVDGTNKLKTQVMLQTLAEHPNCYDILRATSGDWGNYFYYGGPGQNPRCQQ